MRSATVRQLRHDFGSVLDWVEEGHDVTISKRGKIVALLSPPPARKPEKRRKRKDFLARLRRIYGDKVFSDNIVVEDRESRPY